jgi:hypothetical protein
MSYNVSAWHVALIHVGLQDKEQAFAWLEKAYAEQDSNIVNIKVTPEFDTLRSDPRFVI